MKIRLEVRHSERDSRGRHLNKTSVFTVDTDVLTGTLVPGWDADEEPMTSVFRMPMTRMGHSLELVVSKEL